MKLYKAIQEAKTVIEDLLILAEFERGVSLTLAEVEKSIMPLFWYITLTGKSASEKETYVTYSFISCSPAAYSDGKNKGRKVTVSIDLFTRKRNVDDLIKALNDVFVDNDWSFELNSIIYDNGNQMYVHSFSVIALIF